MDVTFDEVKASYQHRMDALRQRVRGRDERLTRWAETALVALRNGRDEVTRERLEEMLDELAKGVQG